MGDIALHFSRSEFACHCKCGFDTVDSELLRILNAVRRHFDQPVTINSACRCQKHNESVGGADNSQHLFGRAADIVVANTSPEEVAAYIDKHFGDRVGLCAYKSFTHVDSRGYKARW